MNRVSDRYLGSVISTDVWSSKLEMKDLVNRISLQRGKKSTNMKLTASRIGEASIRRTAIGVLAYSPSATSTTTPAAARTLIMRTNVMYQPKT